MRSLPGRTSVVLWTDGRPSGNLLGASDVGVRATDAGVSLNVVVDSKAWVDGPARGQALIKRSCQAFDAMTRMTGGVCLMNARGTSAPVRQLEQILEQLRNR